MSKRYIFNEDDVVLNITSARIALGPLRPDMIAAYEGWINSFPVVRALGRLPTPTTTENEQEYYNEARQGNQAVFNIYARVDETGFESEQGDRWWAIGSCDLHSIDHLHRNACFGILIGEMAAWNKGYGSTACRMATEYGFRFHGLNQVWLEVFASNPGGIRAYEKAGYKVVGRRREAHLVGGKLEDIVLMECLAGEFNSKSARKLLHGSEKE